MSKVEFFKAGYTVILGSPYGDMELDAEDVVTYEKDGHLEEVDEIAKVAYFYDEVF